MKFSNYFGTPVGPEYKKKFARNVSIAVLILFAFYGMWSLATQVSEPEQNTKNCTIPHDVNFMERSVISTPQDGKPHYSIKGEFSIHHTVPIGEFSIDDSAQSLILKPVPHSHGYVIMCDPLPALEKRFEKQLDGFMLLVDGEETEPNFVNEALRIDITNNTRIEIIGFSFVGSGK